MNRKDPLLRCAFRVYQRLQNSRQASVRQSVLAGIEDQATTALRRLAVCQLARRRNWQQATRVTEMAAVGLLQQLWHGLNSALPQLQARSESVAPVLREVYEDLQHLELEFGGLVPDPRHRLVAVVTDPITLEDIPLGPFRIELHIDRLANHPGVSAFDVVALKPNPPDCSEDVTHPHVRDRQLCAGEATVPIARALQQGRITDAFLSVRAVLETYNASSPYVALEDWHGRPCSDCGTSVDPDNASTCQQCDQLCCEECISWCDICETAFCRSCLEEDVESGRLCCRSCRHRCGGCNRIVDASSWVEETGLCPECHEDHLQEQENDHDEPDDHNAVPSDSGGTAKPDQDLPVPSQTG